MSNDDQAEASNNEGDGSNDDNVVRMDDDDNEGNFIETNKCDGLTFEEAMEGKIEQLQNLDVHVLHSSYFSFETVKVQASKVVYLIY